MRPMKLCQLPCGGSEPLTYADHLGQPVRVSMYLCHGPDADVLVACSPPGGEPLYVQGIGLRRWLQLSALDQEAVMGGFVERLRREVSRTVDGECPVDESFITEYPALWDFLTRQVLEDGTKRARSKLTLFAEGAVLKGSLTEPDMEMSAFVTGESVLGVLRAMEEAIQSNTLDWRRWYRGGKSGRSK